jgi:FkbM family methyltransferase
MKVPRWKMPSLRGFLDGNARRFRRIRLGRGFSDRCRLFGIAVLQSVPAVVRRQGSVVNGKLDGLTESLCSSIRIRLGSVVYAVRDFEGLQILNPDFEPFMLAWFQPRKHDVFVDIGSHVGKYAIATAKVVGEEGLVVAVEPHPETFKALQVNMKLNHLKNVVALNLAAWNRSCWLKFKSGASSSEFSVDRTCYNNSLDVQAKRMDELIINDLKLWRVDWIKIDVERAEVEVLQGLEETLSRFEPKLIVEVWSKNMEMVKALLKRHGFSMIAISNIFRSGSEWCVYLFCVPTAD